MRDEGDVRVMSADLIARARAGDGEAFRELTQPLIDYYERAGVLSVVGGTGDPEEIYKDIERIVK